MNTKSGKARFVWTAQTDRQAALLTALGRSHTEIADRLGCDQSTVRKHLHTDTQIPTFSFEELLEQCERFDAERNIAELMDAPSGSVEQSRLRRTFRARLLESKTDPSTVDPLGDEEMSDDQLCAEVERLVGRPIRIRDGS